MEECVDRTGKVLCFRCDWRAIALETGHGPRMECHSDVKSANYSCYMYRPVQPVKLKRNAGDDRPLGAPAMFSSRASANGFADMKLCGKGNKENLLMYWVPKERESLDVLKECRRLIESSQVNKWGKIRSILQEWADSLSGE